HDMRYYAAVFFCFCAFSFSFAQSKFDLWKKPSHFRGANLVADQNTIGISDLKNFPAIGATIVLIGSLGSRTVEAPFSIVQQNIDYVDKLVGFCHDANLYYALAIRQGPGRRD